MVVSVVSQKGGVGKSTISRLLAREYSDNNWDVKIADMDTRQGTSTEWNKRRLNENIKPEISVELFSTVEKAKKQFGQYDLIIFDGAPTATIATQEICKLSDLVILPTGIALDDLIPTVTLANTLYKNKIPHEKIIIVFCRVGDSDSELADARDYINKSGYKVTQSFLPERTGYRRASDIGRSATETLHKSLNDKASILVQELISTIERNAKDGEN